MKKFAIYHVYANGDKELIMENVPADDGQVKKDELGRYKVPDENKEWCTIRNLYEEATLRHQQGRVFGAGDSIVFEEMKED